MAPEVLMSSGQYDAAKTDVWACGIILYQMLTGRLPFCHDSNASGVLDRAMMQRILRGQCAPLPVCSCSSQIGCIARGLLSQACGHNTRMSSQLHLNTPCIF